MRAMKKAVVFVIVGLFIGIIIIPIIGTSGIFNDDELDQYCILGTSWSSPIHSQTQLAQSFKPTKNRLTRVELFLCAYGSQYITEPLNVAIRNNLDGQDLTSISVSANVIGNFNWHCFNFEDINVIPEQTYYIVCSSNQPSLEHYYLWSGNSYDEDKYSRGMRWNTGEHNGWIWECCPENEGIFCDREFKTYGYIDIINSCIEIEDIKGGLGLKATMKHNGTNTAENVNWSIDIDSTGLCLILSGEHTEGVIQELPAGESAIIRASGLTGIGPIIITIKAGDATNQATGFLLGPLLLRVEEV